MVLFEKNLFILYLTSIKRLIYYISITIDMTIKNDIELLKYLGEETKYRIVKLLLKGEKCACEIPDVIGRTQSNTSMHLAKLIRGNILKSRRDGKMILYSIKDLRVCDVFKALGYPEGKLLKSCCCMDKNKK